MLHRSGIIANRKWVYRLMKLANLVRKRSVRKHVIMRRILTVPERPDQLLATGYNLYLVWSMMDGAICSASWTVTPENGWHTHSVPIVEQMKL